MTKKKECPEIPKETMNHFTELVKVHTIGMVFWDLIMRGKPFTATFDGKELKFIFTEHQQKDK